MTRPPTKEERQISTLCAIQAHDELLERLNTLNVESYAQGAFEKIDGRWARVEERDLEDKPFQYWFIEDAIEQGVHRMPLYCGGEVLRSVR